MAKRSARDLQARSRALVQAAKFAVRDVYDAIVELVTNADDRYQVLNTTGTVEIEVERRRGKKPSLLRVRDFADGMSAEAMDRKLSSLGGRDSGLDKGEMVRGTHSRGAKDVAALGRVIFESIASDGLYHKCEISPFMQFVPHESSEATDRMRKAIGIPEGSGTLVTIELDTTQRIPQHDNLRNGIAQLVSLRGILADEKRKIVLRDAGQARKHVLRAPTIEDKVRLKETLTIPGYPTASAKLVISRAKERLQREPSRFRLGGILVCSKHAIHEATLFDSGLESDPHALWFYGRLVCPHIDELCNEFDNRFETKLPPEAHNPTYPLDPSRRSGLARDHPFVRVLFGEALKRLRPLVEEERRREEHERTRIETAATRKRLNALEKAALDFMRDFGEEEDAARNPEGIHPESRFMERGYALSPPFVQMVAGHSTPFWLTVRQEAFPEIQTGAAVHIEPVTKEISVDHSCRTLEPHPVREGVLRATWKVRALRPTAATGLRASVDPIEAESAIEVLASEADRYRDVVGLRFDRKRYRVRTDRKGKRVRLLAPLERVQTPTVVTIDVDSSHFTLGGTHVLAPDHKRGVAICELWVKSDGREASGRLAARLGEDEATADIASTTPMGAGLSIKLEDIDLVNQRYRWRQNVLEIAARHPSLRRYLGSKQDPFSGQDEKHFRVLLAEIVSDAVCGLLVRRHERANPEDYDEADWDTFYALYSSYMTRFLPIAHKLVFPEG